MVVVGFPATAIHLGRSRFCISAGHSREDLEYVVKVVAEVSELLNLCYEKRLMG